MRKRGLLSYARAAGCAGKACQTDLFAMLDGLPVFHHPDLLVSGATADDAGIFRLDKNRALVLTVDVLPPVADEPYVFGQIAAANSLSDVYAMGGKPLAALAILGVPVEEIEFTTVRTVLAGAWDKVKEAGAVVAGGHTVRDLELKFGLAVTGIVHPEKVVTNAGARPGDRLLLTKPLGTGVITTAQKHHQAPPQLVAKVNKLMAQLNRAAAEAMTAVGVNAATDITGFGLLGHCWEMAQASGVDIVIKADAVPFLPGVQRLAEEGWFPGGTLKNYEFIRRRAEFARGINKTLRLLLCDAQTSGGLLIAVSEKKFARLEQELIRAGVSEFKEVGVVTVGTGRVRVVAR
ncbi:MAG: selenide, water dikinase SelD [candidate division WOR-3 bacterium]|nr:selenide, water dikinase SelD [candidate division WOR-3 bacterium]MDH7519744.1 selenide, water dikinase SelD [bacterium]